MPEKSMMAICVLLETTSLQAMSVNEFICGLLSRRVIGFYA